MRTHQQIHKFKMSSDTRYQLTSLCLLLMVGLSALPVLRKALNNSPFLSLLYWGTVILSLKFFFTSIHIPGRLSQKSVVKVYAITGAQVFIAISFVVGVLLKSLKGSPYDNSFFGILFNAMTFFSALFAREMIREYTLSSTWRTVKYKHAGIVVITIIMALTEINFSKAMYIKNLESLIIYLVTDVAIDFSKNVLASVLVFFGGAYCSILYFGIIEAFQKTFPFLPELSWLANGTIGISFPLIYSIMIYEHCKSITEEKVYQSPRGDCLYMGALFSAIVFSWFCVGVFTIYPSVILTGSMKPSIQPGDVILIKRFQEEKEIYQLKKGDIINFNREEINITHRIEEIFHDEAGNLSFQTKGDNNKSSDQALISPNDINGIVINVVPKIGFPALIIRSKDDIPTGVIDYDQ